MVSEQVLTAGSRMVQGQRDGGGRAVPELERWRRGQRRHRVRLGAQRAGGGVRGRRPGPGLHSDLDPEDDSLRRVGGPAEHEQVGRLFFRHLWVPPPWSHLQVLLQPQCSCLRDFRPHMHIIIRNSHAASVRIASGNPQAVIDT